VYPEGVLVESNNTQAFDGISDWLVLLMKMTSRRGSAFEVELVPPVLLLEDGKLPAVSIW
jgi:hypothetical protein